ncbi:YitT family protein [Planococcus glaciei]|uniref:YitT family protein n=1 Tax=Planococcus glaciei TaxID=459472 RepID=UPI001C72BC1F|nr:YitT family protein [Planococcus glaciei]MBX0315294.1 YitT family protein [Planococcus glaciei]
MGIKYHLLIYDLLGITIGCFLFAFGTNSLLTPANLLAGGLGGVCVIFYHLFDWPIGIQYFIYNVPLLILGYLHIGRKFIIYTVFSVVVSSIFFDVIPVKAVWTSDTMLCAVFGAIISGAGAALILRLGGSVGGLDILSRVIAKYFNISIGNFGLLVSATIIVFSAMLFDIQAAMYTILSFIIGAKAYDIVLNIAERRTVIILTSEGQRISSAINETLDRGTTSWLASETSTEAPENILLCVIIKREWAELLKISKEIDPHSFILALPTDKIAGKFEIDW